MRVARTRYTELARRLGLLPSQGRALPLDSHGGREFIGCPPSDGEVHYVWSFLYWGSVMEPDIRGRLRQAWGLCERHAWAFLSVEAAFRPHFLHASALVYEDLMGRARQAFRLMGPWKAGRLRHALREQEPCIMCDIGYGPHSRGAASSPLLKRGRDVASLRGFAEATRPWWGAAVCGICSGEGSPVRCRRHLRDELLDGVGARQVEDAGHLVWRITEHVVRFSNSFRWELRGTDTQEDRAALISAVGWCSGWRPLLAIVGSGLPRSSSGPSSYCAT